MGREAIQRIEEHTFPPHTFAWAQTTYNEKLGGIPFVILWPIVQHMSSVSRQEGTTQRWQKPTVRPRGSGHRERVNVTYWWWDGPLASWLPCYFLFRRSYLTSFFNSLYLSCPPPLYLFPIAVIQIITDLATWDNTYLLSHSSQGSGIRTLGWTESSSWGLTKLMSGCWLGCILTWSLIGKELTSKPIQVVGRIHFLVVIWPSATAFYWL